MSEQNNSETDQKFTPSGLEVDQPNSPEVQLPESVMVGFSDGGAEAIGYKRKGDEIQLGLGSRTPHGRDFDQDGPDMLIMRTENGTTWALGGGLMIESHKDSRTLNVWEQPDPVGNFTVKIGEPVTVPDLFTSAPVKSVMLRYKGGAKVSEHSSLPNPFTKMSNIVRNYWENKYTVL